MFKVLKVHLAEFNISGSGVFASENIEKGQLISYYEGELISGEEGQRRFETLEEKDGCFLFFFSHKGKKLW